MPEKQATKCVSCGRTPVFGAQFCPYCGTPLEMTAVMPGGVAKSAPPPAVRSVLPAPDRMSLEGECAILYCGEGPYDIRRAGRLVSEALKRPIGDVTRTMKVSRGIIAHGIAADLARSLAERLEAEGIPVLLVTDESLHDLPRVMRMKSAGFSPEGLHCEAYLWDATEKMSIPWHSVLLVSCGRLNLSEVVEVEQAGDSQDAKARRHRLQLRPELAPLSTETWHEYVMDFFVLEPRIRLRLDENSSAYALVDVGSLTEGKRAFYKAASQIIKHAPDVPVNEGVQLLATNAPAELWETVLFSDKSEFDSYNMWLLQLARYGYPIAS